MRHTTLPLARSGLKSLMLLRELMEAKECCIRPAKFVFTAFNWSNAGNAELCHLTLFELRSLLHCPEQVHADTNIFPFARHKAIAFTTNVERSSSTTINWVWNRLTKWTERPNYRILHRGHIHNVVISLYWIISCAEEGDIWCFFFLFSENVEPFFNIDSTFNYSYPNLDFFSRAWNQVNKKTSRGINYFNLHAKFHVNWPKNKAARPIIHIPEPPKFTHFWITEANEEVGVWWRKWMVFEIWSLTSFATITYEDHSHDSWNVSRK